MADWMPPGPNPQTLLSSMLGENFGSRTSESTNEGESGFSFNGHPKQLTNYSDESQAQSAFDQTTRFHGGLLERMAARAGFNAPRLNTETIRSVDLSQNRGVPSPFFTIPTGLSPTTLLESPVFISNSRAQPSPTTGKLSFVPPSGVSRSSGLFTESADRSNEKSFGGMSSSSFAFRPDPSHFFGSSDRESFQFPSIEVSVQSENTTPPRNLEHSKGVAQNQQEDSCILSNEKDTGGGNMSEQRTTTTGSVVLEHSSPLDEQQDDEADQRGGGDLNGVESPAEDGYNWRKYGQKQVKGSDFPRSYYKCTHTNCPVKKKIERSVQGHITEIIYKGVHSHPKPLPHRKSSASFGDMQLESGQCGFTGGGGDPVWRNVQRGNMASEWRHDNLDVTSSTMFGSQYGNGTKSLPIQNGSQFESGDASSTYSNDEDDDEHGTHGSASVVVDDGGGDESESKKRKLEAYAADMSGATRAMREPRVVVQTTSEVDILDDGYRWRKYGQKVVKGNPNPRSYYKCTSAGCSVRKHVERASHDLKSVITTYEGKHNHDVPAARNTSHVNSSSNVQSQVLKPEPSQFRNSMSHFDRSSNSFGSFGLPNRPLLIPPQDIGYSMTQRNMPNLALLGGWGGPNHSQGGLGLPFLQGLQYPGQQQHQQQQQQQRPVNEMELMLPKGEPKVEPVSDSGLSLPNASSIYQQVMSRMPLGPHM